MNKKIQIKEDIKKLSFEEALSELEGIVERLERGDIDCLLYTSPSPRDPE